VLTFEGVSNGALVGSFYAGVGGPDLGVVFGRSALGEVDSDEGGWAPVANEPSASTVLAFLNEVDATMTVATGFSKLSFQYASGNNFTVTVLDGPSGTGVALADATVLETPQCGRSAGYPRCGDPEGAFGIWRNITVPFSGVATSIRLNGELRILFIDNLTFSPPEPPCTKTTYWVWDPTTDELVGELWNNSASCIAALYNIEVRPCALPATTPVKLKLMNSAYGTIKTQKELAAPFYVWGDTTATGDVYRNTVSLPVGTYWLDSTFDGTSRFAILVTAVGRMMAACRLTVGVEANEGAFLS
jgi:hypothetical protein